MKANRDHISLETARLLEDCGVESKFVFVDEIFRDDDRYYTYIATFSEEILENKKINKLTPAFTWQEILWEYSKEFFGEDEYDTDTLYCTRVWEAWGYKTMTDNDFERIYIPNYQHHTNEIKSLLQQVRYTEADLYFRKNCILIKKGVANV